MNREARELWQLSKVERPRREPCPLLYIDYCRYLKTAHWRRLRARIRAQRNDQCEACGRDRDPRGGVFLHVHHLTYERLGVERDEDMQLLCASCHEHAHADWDPFVFI